MGDTIEPVTGPFRYLIALRNNSRELCGEPGGPAWECPRCVLGLVIPELIRSGLTWMSLTQHHELLLLELVLVQAGVTGSGTLELWSPGLGWTGRRCWGSGAVGRRLVTSILMAALTPGTAPVHTPQPGLGPEQPVGNRNGAKAPPWRCSVFSSPARPQPALPQTLGVTRTWGRACPRCQRARGQVCIRVLAGDPMQRGRSREGPDEGRVGLALSGACLALLLMLQKPDHRLGPETGLAWHLELDSAHWRLDLVPGRSEARQIWEPENSHSRK